MKTFLCIAGLILVLLPSSATRASGDDRTTFRGPVRVLEVNLYRGLVRIRAEAGAKNLSFRRGRVDWDRWTRGTDPWPQRRDLAEELLETETRGDTVRISAPTVRDLVALEITIPAAVELIVHIDHYGDVEVRGARAGIEVEQFQGRITLEDVSGPLVANITRDGDIQVRFADRPAARAMALTTYEGNIDLEVPAAAAGRLKITTLEGDIRNDLGRPTTLTSAQSFIRVRNARGTIHVRPTR